MSLCDRSGVLESCMDESDGHGEVKQRKDGIMNQGDIGKSILRGIDPRIHTVLYQMGRGVGCLCWQGMKSNP